MGKITEKAIDIVNVNWVVEYLKEEYSRSRDKRF